MAVAVLLISSEAYFEPQIHCVNRADEFKNTSLI